MAVGAALSEGRRVDRALLARLRTGDEAAHLITLGFAAAILLIAGLLVW